MLAWYRYSFKRYLVMLGYVVTTFDVVVDLVLSSCDCNNLVDGFVLKGYIMCSVLAIAGPIIGCGCGGWSAIIWLDFTNKG